MNQATNRGGAIASVSAAALTIHASTISGNNATGFGAIGGGLYIENTLSTVIDQDTSITGNDATADGGGLYFSAIFFNTCSLSMDGGEIYGNTAGGNGGGLYMAAASDTVTLTGVTVSQNGATGKGGGAYVKQGTLAGSLAHLTGNTATGGIPGIAYKGNQVPTITVPPGEQTIQQDP